MPFMRETPCPLAYCLCPISYVALDLDRGIFILRPLIGWLQSAQIDPDTMILIVHIRRRYRSPCISLDILSRDLAHPYRDIAATISRNIDIAAPTLPKAPVRRGLRKRSRFASISAISIDIRRRGLAIVGGIVSGGDSIYVATLPIGKETILDTVLSLSPPPEKYGRYRRYGRAPSFGGFGSPYASRGDMDAASSISPRPLYGGLVTDF